jgi:CRP/FNR family transcriptional regulator, cyclic AMP receptor protein
MMERSISPKEPRDAWQFDSALWLETATKGRKISKHRKGEIIFSQGDEANAVFYIKKARSKSPSYPSRARKPW